MSIKEFTTAMQSKVVKDWFAKLDKNIINANVDTFRSSQQVAKKTDLVITGKDIKNIFKGITGSEPDALEVQIILRQLAENSGAAGPQAKRGVMTKTASGDTQVFFDSIAFDSITTILNRILDNHPEIDEGLYQSEEKYKKAAFAELEKKFKVKAITAPKYKEEWRKIDNFKQTIGSFFDKGHVISIATNLTKQYRDQILKDEEVLGKQISQEFVKILDQYIAKLQEDDLRSANLPNAVTQELYVKYTKSTDKYLVEFQAQTINRQSGTGSKEVIAELKALFNPSTSDLMSVLNNGVLANTLVTTPGSPSYLDLILTDVLNILSGSNAKKQKYSIPNTLIGKKVIKINKPKRRTREIQAAKHLRAKIAVPKTSTTAKNKLDELSTQLLMPLSSLEALMQARLTEQIKNNMGQGDRRDVLNLRTGRLAESANIERIVESREGMLTVFYTYMKYPYATFSRGGRQERPYTRDPKLLISKSIREIGADLAANRMRAVNV